METEKFIYCDDEHCDDFVKNHAWGKIKAEAWFFSRDNEKAYCPKHIPDWVWAWRTRKKNNA